MGASPLILRGASIWQGWLDRDAQSMMLQDIRDVVRKAPLLRPITPRGQAMSVRMSAAGRFGWVSDSGGYRYSEQHPQTGTPWPEIPHSVMAVWTALSGYHRPPECCLVNFYDSQARMGMHQDRDEQDFDAPVVSISLGEKGLFRIGNHTRGGKTDSLWLNSGDVVVMGGDARLRYHGIDRIQPGSSTLMPNGGRVNLTLRVVTPPA